MIHSQQHGGDNMVEARKVKTIVPTHTVTEGGGFKVRRPAAMGSLMSPFLLLDEMGPANYGPGEAVGAPWHPHRGFETVTYMLSGEMEHEDSVGSKGVITPGDIQWMTAGKGIIHSEMPTKKMMDEGGLMHGFQIWVNLPAKDKMTEPKYQNIENKDLAKVDLGNGIGSIDIIAGEFEKHKGPASSFTPMSLFNVKLNKGKGTSLSFNENHNTGLLIIKGKVIINNKERAPTNHFVLFENKGKEFTIKAEDYAERLVLSGEPIDEPIASYGPFVMNTNDEIKQTIDDFNSGKFGYLD